SVAVVPVGLTRFRPTEDELISVSPEKATEIINQVSKLQEKFLPEFGTTFAWLADEWFLIAGQDLPEASYYENYPQIDNGVGSIQQFIEGFKQAALNLPSQITTPKTMTWVVGNTVERAFQPIVQALNQVEGLTIKMAALSSDYWGQSMTVTGLLTGSDLVQKLRGRDLGDGLLLPTLMLKHGTEQFLDDMTIDDVSRALNISIFKVGGGPQDLINACLRPLSIENLDPAATTPKLMVTA
ncbi:MAG: DUF512 domain-containing protein, partial [Cyanobacteria bacterium P01_F01_bin.42]